MDDLNRKFWVYFIKEKFAAFPIFKRYINIVLAIFFSFKIYIPILSGPTYEHITSYNISKYQ